MIRAHRGLRPTRVLRVSVVIALLSSALAACAPTTATPAPAQRTFTDSQATRGLGWFDATCLSCHLVHEVSSAEFKFRWGGRSALDLYDRISTTMPEDAPGTLSRRAYTDIVSYLMQINGLPAGTVPLTADSLALASVRLSFRTNSPDPR